MKKIILLILLFGFSCAVQAMVLHDSQGNVINSSQFKGKWIIINYWAGWCDGCIKEIPELNNFYRNNKNQNVLLFGVNYDQLSFDVLRQAVQRLHIKFPVLAEDPNTLWNFGDISIIPVTYIINPQGKVVKKILGANTEQSLTDTLNALAR